MPVSLIEKEDGMPQQPASIQGIIVATLTPYGRDGAPDLYVSGYHGSALFHNQGDGTFREVSAAAGVRNTDGWETSRSIADTS